MTAARVARTIELSDRSLEFLVAKSPNARKIRIRVAPSGVEVVQPRESLDADVDHFLLENETWLLNQIDRVSRLSLASYKHGSLKRMLFRGEFVSISIVPSAWRTNRVEELPGELRVHVGRGSSVLPAATLQNWLRTQARIEVSLVIAAVSQRLGLSPGRLYIMDQRTKWGNCSSKGNLSINWRIIMAPDWVLEYLVAHETTHLAVPNHSKEFWLTLQSVCPDVDRARGWLSTNYANLRIDLRKLLPLEENN
jgi:predicted metal-dependent hydrolase